MRDVSLTVSSTRLQLGWVRSPTGPAVYYISLCLLNIRVGELLIQFVAKAKLLVCVALGRHMD